ncbi:caspase family protein [bacterium]|nr:caspase family protein [bacterium]MBU4361532.1 caspase family protein [bacterium]MBU4602101.1 caspase family protein [bacterium]MCG2761600.1 caspase family protein [Candidatus Atribacteria bacterium]
MLGKKSYLLLYILIIAVLLLASGCLYYYPAVYTFGSIGITTNPPRAKIFLDSMDTGYFTPSTLTNISAGNHVLILALADYLSYSCIINVIANRTINLNISLTPIIPPTPKITLTGISVFPSTINLTTGESQTFDSVTAYYSNSSSANVNLTACNYSSSDPGCATVSNNGTVTAVSDGSATITISYTEGGVTKTTPAEITVGTVTQNEVVYRALCVGVGDYIQGSDNDLSAPPYDVDRIRQILQQCRFGTSNTIFSNIGYLKDWQATKSNILQSISSIFSGADSNDISYFYFSGHGALVGNTSYICPADMTSFANLAISVDELESALSAIPGTKVVFLDSCYSGGFIGKGKEEIIVSRVELESFNDEVINVFSQAQPKGLLTTNQYKVLTSCHYYQLCWEIQPAEGNPFGLFTMALCEGCGYSGNYPADTNMDTMVSLQEAYLYVKDWVFSYRISQDVQIYPANSTFTIVEY